MTKRMDEFLGTGPKSAKPAPLVLDTPVLEQVDASAIEEFTDFVKKVGKSKKKKAD